MLLKAKSELQRDQRRSQFNAINVGVVIDLALKMIDARVLKPEDITILMCYQAQRKVYHAKLMSFYAEYPQCNMFIFRFERQMDGKAPRRLL